jgi:hypothetical protein
MQGYKQTKKGIINMGTFIFLLGILAAIGVVYPLLVITGVIKD